MRKSIQRAVLALSAMTAVAGSVFVTSPAMAASSPIAACGGGKYHIVDKHVFKKSGKKVATTFLLYNGKTDCVITWKAHRDKKFISAEVIKQGDKQWTIPKKFHYGAYVLVKRSAHGACIAWGGEYDTDHHWRTHKWVHCGK